MRDKKTQNDVVSTIGRILKKDEIKYRRSRRAKSIQRLHDVKGFNWEEVIDKVAEHAPNLVQILTECTRKIRSSQM